MPDTIELLEAIGRDASLRRAPADELEARLAQANASAALKAAAASGDASLLLAELGQKPMYAPQSSQTAQEEGDMLPAEDDPAQLPPAPDPGTSQP